MTACETTDQRRIRVLMIGPMAPAVGGMVTVIEQLLDGPLRQQVDLLRHPANSIASARRSLLRSVARHLGQLGRLARSLLRERVDVVHIHTCSGFTFYRNLLDAAVARCCGVAVAIHVHGAQFDRFCAGGGPARRWAIRLGLEWADRVVVLSEHWQRQLRPYAPRAQFAVVPNGVPAPTRLAQQEHRASDDPVRFLFLGALGHRKGTDVLLEAACELRTRGLEFSLTLAGPVENNGPDDSWQATADRLGLAGSTEFVGAVDGPARDALLERRDCLVLPSRAEGLPLALLEAGARGLPVVTTAVGAIPELITDDSLGLVVPPGDPRRLADAMHGLAGDPLQRQALGAALRSRVLDRYSVHHQSDLLADIYRDVTREHEAVADVAHLGSTPDLSTARMAMPAEHLR